MESSRVSISGGPLKQRVKALDFRGLVELRHDADERLSSPGQAVLVRRGVDRSLTMICPDDCGETLTINLDQRSGAAWRIYLEGHSVSLYPSVWRHTGCRSHFILWRSRIYWCDWNEELQSTDGEFESMVLSALGPTLQSCADLATQLDAVPWAVLSACRVLRRRDLASEGFGDQQGWFRHQRN